MIYLDSAATSLKKPKCVAAAADHALTTMASPGRGGHKPSMKAAECVLNCRILLASYFNVRDFENVIFTFNATHALNIAINSIVRPGDKVVVSGYEHNAVMRPLKALGADIRIAASPLFDEKAAVDAVKRALPGARCVVYNHVSNVFGFILPLEEVSALCHKFKVPLIVDASQSAGIIPIDFTALGAAFIAMPGHKGLLGPQGTGVLLCSGRHPVKPLLFGGTGSDSVKETMPEYLPDMLEAGTHNVCGIAGLHAGIKYLMSKPEGAIFAYERKLCAILADRLYGLSGLKVYYTNDDSRQIGLISIISENISCEELFERLNKAGIYVRAGMHCAPTAHSTVGTLKTGTVRFSFSPFVSQKETVFAAETVKKVLSTP